MADPIISVHKLHKTYGQIQAVRGIDFSIESGEIFGILGPNGAGKTTTIEILEGLRLADQGEVRVAGFDPRRHQDAFHQTIGVQLQHTAMFERIRVTEALTFFAGCYQRGTDTESMLKRFKLKELEKSCVKNLSGGEKQRLTLALALINDPQVIFLDEPTTGMDPHARRAIWQTISELKEQGRTILLSTHNMEEAEHLCDRIAIIDQGKIIALGTPRELIKALGADKKIAFTLQGHADLNIFNKIPGVSKAEQQNSDTILYTTDPQQVLLHILSQPPTSGLVLNELRVSDANLEDVFIHLTGRKLS